MRTYQEIVEYILSYVRKGNKVCVAFYGHPGVFVFPSHEAIKRARNEGYRAEMLPGISAEDCLYSDIGIDPGADGCQCFESTDFLSYRRKFDPSVGLVLWQIAVIGELGSAQIGYVICMASKSSRKSWRNATARSIKS